MDAVAVVDVDSVGLVGSVGSVGWVGSVGSVEYRRKSLFGYAGGGTMLERKLNYRYPQFLLVAQPENKLFCLFFYHYKHAKCSQKRCL